MKILQINVFNYRKGGSEVVYFSTMELLRMHGEEVVNFALRWPENYPSEYESYFPESKETRSELLKPVKNIINYFNKSINLFIFIILRINYFTFFSKYP